jgi:PTH1 family peptidyl-tRNA hydrolase
LKLIYGLGNPGADYAKTRHNFGAWVVDALARDRKCAYGPGKGDYIFGVKGDKLAIVKSTGYMNESGWPLFDAMDFLKVDASDVIVVYDDINIPLGTIRLRGQGSAGGHRGMESIVNALGTDDFARLRLGIATETTMRPSEDYVLAPFRDADRVVVDEVIQTSVEALEHYLVQGLEATMTKFNSRSSE